MNKFVALLCVLPMLLLAACAPKSAENKAAADVVESAEMEEQDVPYSIAKRYFVKNTIGEFNINRIADKETFEQYFGMAAVMGRDGLPTTIDFEQEFVIPVVLPETGYELSIVPVSLRNNGRGELLFNCRVDTLRELSYTIRPLLLTIVSKSFDTDNVVVEID